MNHRTAQEYIDSRVRAVEHRNTLGQVHHQLGRVEEQVRASAATIDAGFEAVIERTKTTHTSVMAMQNVVQHVLDFVRTFPQEIRDRLQAMTQADWRTYQAVLRLQDHILHMPNAQHASYIEFTNALGEHRLLPYEYFCHWEVRKLRRDIRISHR